MVRQTHQKVYSGTLYFYAGPISITRFVGILKNSVAFMAFFDMSMNNRSRHFIMLEWAPKRLMREK